MPTPLNDAVRSGPRVLLRLEGAVGLSILIAAYAWSGHSWWLFGTLFFVPDLSMLVYLANARVGAAGYNTAHSLIGPGLLAGAGHPARQPPSTLASRHLGCTYRLRPDDRLRPEIFEWIQTYTSRHLRDGRFCAGIT
jgi:hypothetical protein